MLEVTTSFSVGANTIKLYDCTVEAQVSVRGGLCFVVYQGGVLLDTYAYLEHAIQRCVNQ